MGHGVRGTQPASFVAMPERRIESVIPDCGKCFTQRLEWMCCVHLEPAVVCFCSGAEFQR